MGLIRGRPTRSAWRLGGLTLGRLVGRVWHELWQDAILGRAAELAYFFLFAVFPLLLFLTTLLGYLAREDLPLGRELFRIVSTLSPSADVTALLQDTLAEIAAARSGSKLTLGLAIALFAASSGVQAVGRTLNVTYDLKETRQWWRRRLESVALIVVFSILAIFALGLFFFGEGIADWAARALDLGPILGRPLWNVGQWVLILLSAVGSFDFVYNYAPAVRAADRVWLTPGAVVGAVLWLAASRGFQVYLSYFPSYSLAYGSLGAVILTLFWFYLTGASILLGGEINSEIARAAKPARAKGPAAVKARSRPRARSSARRT